MQAKPDLKIVLCSPRGFCAGVVRAIDTVERALTIYGAPVYVRHEIVHNRYVVDSLKTKGAIFVEELAEIPDNTNAPVVFSAHGVPKSVPADARARNFFSLDATCPLVTKVHLEVVAFARKGYTIIFVGHKDHDETIGTLGEAPGEIRVVGSKEEARCVEVTNPDKVVYLTQTTLSVDDTREIVEVLHERFPRLQAPAKEDICYATQNRQDAVKALASQVDILLVLGAPNSSNSLRLCEVAQARNVRAYLIETAADIRAEWLEGVRVIGLTASASAPEILVQQVIQFARDLGVADIEELDTVREDVHFSLPHELSELSKTRARALPERESPAHAARR
jgi:4-hydroxy-3-methylbut-2-enyl diphosphate reductase